MEFNFQYKEDNFYFPMIKIGNKKKKTRVQPRKPLLVMQKYLNEKRNRNNPCLKDITPRLISRNKCSQSVKKFDQPTLIKYKKYNDNTPPASSPFYITKKQICNKKKYISEGGITFQFENLFSRIQEHRSPFNCEEKLKLLTLPTMNSPLQHNENQRKIKMVTIESNPKKKVIYHSKFRPQTSLHKYPPCKNQKKQEKTENEIHIRRKQKTVNQDLDFSEMKDFKAWQAQSVQNIPLLI